MQGAAKLHPPRRVVRPSPTVKGDRVLNKLRQRFTYANVMSTLAVFIALGGSSYAALKVTGRNVPKDALTGADIKNITGRDVTNNSLTGTDVKGIGTGDVSDGALLAQDFKRGQLPAGAQGQRGEKGDKGDPGQDGAAGSARAFAISGGPDCPAAPVSACTVERSNEVAYVIKVAHGIYCVGVNNISAANSVAVVSVASDPVGRTPFVDSEADSAIWRSNNSACVANEFEVQTYAQLIRTAGNTTNDGSVPLAAPARTDNQMIKFAILIP